jgi:hypothetical protein
VSSQRAAIHAGAFVTHAVKPNHDETMNRLPLE